MAGDKEERNIEIKVDFKRSINQLQCINLFRILTQTNCKVHLQFIFMNICE